MGQDESIAVYQKQWSYIVKLLQVDKTNCIHHGYYEKGIHTHVHAVLNMNDFVGRLLALDTKKTHMNHILDAGCGIGGTMIHLAKKYPHIKWTGITVVPEHIETAKKLAQEHHVAHQTHFLVKDFTSTDFPAEYFDAIYLLESSCYAKKKNMLIHELDRILKPNGMLVIIDVFLTDIQLTPVLKNIYRWFCTGWGLSDLMRITDFIDTLKTHGFHDIVNKDITHQVTPSILRGDVLSIPFLFSLLGHKIFLGKNYQIKEDAAFFGVLPVFTTILGLKKALVYTAVTAQK